MDKYSSKLIVQAKSQPKHRARTRQSKRRSARLRDWLSRHDDKVLLVITALLLLLSAGTTLGSEQTVTPEGGALSDMSAQHFAMSAQHSDLALLLNEEVVANGRRNHV